MNGLRVSDYIQAGLQREELRQGLTTSLAGLHYERNPAGLNLGRIYQGYSDNGAPPM
jgi:hypothetical protein